MQQSSVGTFEIVRAYDPACDWPEDDGLKACMEYVQWRDPKDLLLVDPSIAVPSTWVCRRLTLAQRRQVTETAHEIERLRRCFAYGIVAVKNYVDENGNTVATLTPRRNKDAGAIDDKTLEQFDEVDVLEVGSVIWAQSFLARGVKPRCQLLATSAAALDTVRYQSAVRRKNAETQQDSSSS